MRGLVSLVVSGRGTILGDKYYIIDWRWEKSSTLDRSFEKRTFRLDF